jgi:rubrerythrin
MKLDVAVSAITERRLLPSGASAKGQFQCNECGYGVTVTRELPRCPMCAGEEWHEAAWTPLTSARALA